MLAVCCVIAVVYRVQKRLGRKSKSVDIVGDYDLSEPQLNKIQQKAQKKEQEARMNSVAITSPQHCKFRD